MKNEWFTNAIRRELDSSKLSPLPQVSRAAHAPATAGARTLEVQFPRVPPILWLVDVHSRRPQRLAAPPVPRRSLLPGRREKLATLRAAELADWQASGGDFLRGGHHGDNSSTQRFEIQD